jgi:hypothetical protein
MIGVVRLTFHLTSHNIMSGDDAPPIIEGAVTMEQQEGARGMYRLTPKARLTQYSLLDAPSASAEVASEMAVTMEQEGATGM